jgi:hypothetical protein
MRQERSTELVEIFSNQTSKVMVRSKMQKTKTNNIMLRTLVVGFMSCVECQTQKIFGGQT